MRVNLSYSVELEEVLTAVEKLYTESRERFERDYNMLTKISPLLFSNASLESTLRTTEEMRQALAAYETKLEEIRGILTGYSNILNAPPPQHTEAVATPEPVISLDVQQSEEEDD
tara:strand:+ start:19693 stop:20037 length:345 start_codon:yes stop_codon:yes gene_type:complete